MTVCNDNDNLYSHYKATGEPEMLERQLSAFQDVIRRLNAKHLGWDTPEEGGLARDLPVVQVCNVCNVCDVCDVYAGRFLHLCFHVRLFRAASRGVGM